MFVNLPPSREDVIVYINNNPDEVIKIIRENETVYKTIKETIIKELTNEEIIDIIREIPPERIVEYLTEEQIKEILMKNQVTVMQSIYIVSIEYIIFAGDSQEINGDAMPPAVTNLTTQEKNYNTSTVTATAKTLADNDNYLIMLHGHANPTQFTDGETLELEALSTNRARAVETQLKADFQSYKGYSIDNSRVSTSGYGGDKNIMPNNSPYTPLNRRVEMILLRIETTRTNI